MAAAPGDRLLDVGCGTKPTVQLARAGDHAVTGITLSEVEVERGRARAAAEGLADRVRFERADAASLPFGDGSFDGAMALQSMMHIQDRPRVLAELARVLRPRARLVLTDVADGLGDFAAVPECGLLLARARRLA